LVLSVDQLLECGREFHLSKHPYPSCEHPGKRPRSTRPPVLCLMNNASAGANLFGAPESLTADNGMQAGPGR
jgi:hypothetical protein